MWGCVCVGCVCKCVCVWLCVTVCGCVWLCGGVLVTEISTAAPTPDDKPTGSLSDIFLQESFYSGQEAHKRRLHHYSTHVTVVTIKM